MTNDATPIRVLLADDNQLARLGLAALIQTDPDLTIVGQAVDGAEALTMYRKLLPDVVVADLKMPNVDGIQLTAAICKENPPGRVLALTQYEGDESVLRVLNAGALGYVTKDIDGDELLDAIRKVARGQRYIPAAIATKLADMVTRPLSMRELQILELLRDGQSNKSIADSVSISERTVGVHVSNILTKLEAKNRAEAVAIAIKRGVLNRS
jgi:two-component system, NarL family, response regulator